MKKALVRILATVGASVLLSLLLSLGVGLFTKHHVAKGTVLEIDFGDRIVEYAPQTVEELFRSPPTTVRDIVDALERAAGDDRVVAVVARVGDARLGLATLQELRDAVVAFRQSGKRTVAMAESFGEFGPGNGAYYLATGFGEIYLQPSGDLGITGLASETPFVRGALDKLGVTPRLDHRREYKNAMNIFTEHGFTKAHREASEHVLQGQFDQIVRGIAAARSLSENEVRALVARAPLSAVQAHDAKLVDELAYRDEVWDQFRRDGELPPRLSVEGYLARAGRPHEGGDAIALVYGVGNVHRGASGWGMLSGDPTMGSDTVAGAIRAAVDDEDVRAILFRVDSPGGSYVASDVIWREVVRARRLGKPVVVSMGDVAGSGGYFVAMAADRIVAQPGTITGSIGVLGGKMVTTELWDKLGVQWGDLVTSPNADMWTSTKDYTEAQWRQIEQFLDRIYDDFVTKAAEGRHLEKSRVQEIAKGRIWTGEDAKELGLVDALGGFPEAMRLVREVAGIAPDAEVHLALFPRPKSPVERLLGRLMHTENEPDAAAVVAGATIAEQLRSLPPVRAVLAMLDRRGVLAMPPAGPVRW